MHDITVKSLKNGYTFEEKPITVKKRQYNISKIKILRDGTKILETILRAKIEKTD